MGAAGANRALTVRARTDDGPAIATEHVVTATGHLDRLVAALPGFTPATRELELPSGERVEVVFEPRAAGDDERRPRR
jgi:hypothetical protein